MFSFIFIHQPQGSASILDSSSRGDVGNVKDNRDFARLPFILFEVAGDYWSRQSSIVVSITLVGCRWICFSVRVRYLRLGGALCGSRRCSRKDGHDQNRYHKS